MTAPHLNTEEKAQIVTLAADGQPPTRIASQIARSPHTVRKVLQEPEIQRQVQDEKVVLAEKYRAQAHRVLDSISDEDIFKASLQQKSISSGILLDKSLVLGGEIPINVDSLLAVVEIIRSRPLRRVQDVDAERRRERILPASVKP